MTSPFVRRRRLAAELRTLREERGLTADELGQRVYQSRMKVSRLENARIRPDIAFVMKILDALDVTGDRRDHVIGIARDANERGWWDAIGDAMGVQQRMFADIESGAASIKEYNQMTIPGPLQTPDFTWAIIEQDQAEAAELPYVPESSVRARMRRQEAIFRPDGPSGEVIIDEFVLRRLAVPRTVMAAQLRHIVDVLTRFPRFSVRILPLDAVLSPGRLPPSTFMTFTFTDPADPPIAIADTTGTNVVHTAVHQVAHYEHLFDRLRQASLPELESRSLLGDTADRLSEQIGPGT